MAAARTVPDPEQEELPPPVEIDVRISAESRRAELIADVEVGLFTAEKSIPPNWFYDEVGSLLFEEITRLPEYYPTRTEAEILAWAAERIIGASGARAIVEIGSGISEKTRQILDEMECRNVLESIDLLDVSEEVLVAAAHELATRYRVPVKAVVGDFRRDLSALAGKPRRLVLFLGGTIGNLTPEGRRRFLVDLEATMSYDDCLLLGTDLVKEHDRLVAAYDDSAGVTARFNKNVLSVLNRELAADFDPAAFAHIARFDEDQQRIEMRLRSLFSQQVYLGDLDRRVTFAEGEELLTEISTKFTPAGIAAELATANFRVEETFTDAEGDFLLTLARPYC